MPRSIRRRSLRGARVALALAALALAAAALPGRAAAQTAAATAPPDTPAATAAATPAAGASDETLRTATGALVVPAGTRTGNVVVLRGPLDVHGTVDGSAIAMDDIVVHPGARVAGDVISILGTVRAAAGTVTGRIRARDGADARGAEVAARRAESSTAAPASPLDRLKIVAGWMIILLVIGLGVLVTASPYLDGVAESLEGGVARAVGIGIVGQMLLLPALLALVVALAITIVGVLAIPLGVVAFVLGVAGLVTLGFLAVAFVTGRALAGGGEPTARQRAAAARGDALRALTLGLGIYLSIWFAAAAFSGVPVVAVVLRTVAIGVTWVAATAGFGAALISRAGTRQPKRVEMPAARPGVHPDPRGLEPVAAGAGDRATVPPWQTPTPITGIVAARRPAPAPAPPPRD